MSYDHDYDMHYAYEPDYDEEIEEPEDDPNAKYPHIHVKLIGEDGNGVLILGRVRKALQRGGASQEDVEKFTAEATAGNYDVLLHTCTQWVTVE